jgi:nucleoside 2-deoxyribosyltransferase
MTPGIKKTVFINAALSTLWERELNATVVELLRELGLDYFSPQDELPPGSQASATKILQANTRALEHADIVLCVLDKPGLGVAFELGHAAALGKTIILFRKTDRTTSARSLKGSGNRRRARERPHR